MRGHAGDGVLVVDELGFHQDTSVAELLAARGHAVEVVTPALVVGQDLGLTLDREGFRRRAHAAGIRCRTDLAVLGVLPLVFLAELGFAVAFGVLLDTLIVRSLLVPALTLQIGDRVWWPSALARPAAAARPGVTTRTGDPAG